MNTFDPIFALETPRGEMNFIGATRKYFDEINKDCNAETKSTYIGDYNNTIFPCIDSALPIKEYDDEILDNIIEKIRTKYNFSEGTIDSRIKHLVFDPCSCYGEHEDCTGLLWGAGYKFGSKYAKGEDINQALMGIRKSLLPEESIKLAHLFYDNPHTYCGERVGLAIMFAIGCRNNEAAALRFRDIKELKNYPQNYYIVISSSTEKGRNTVKASGKTRNSPRRLPISNMLYEFLKKRKKYLEKSIEFPCVGSNGEKYYSVDELPIACRGNNFTTPCSSGELSVAGKTVLREIGMNEKQVSGISALILSERGKEEELGEKDPTTYLFRRNLATTLYHLMFTSLQEKYYMGHALDDVCLIRADFGDEEFLYEMKLLIDKHPLNIKNENVSSHFEDNVCIKNTNYIEIEISATEKEQDYYAKIENREISDPVTIDVISGRLTGTIVEGISMSEQEIEINILNTLDKTYKKAADRLQLDS